MRIVVYESLRGVSERAVSGTRITAGMALADTDDAIDVITAYVVGFVIEEQERRQSAEVDPERYSLARRDAWLGDGPSLLKQTGHARDDGNQRSDRHLGEILDGLAVRAKQHDGGTLREK